MVGTVVIGGDVWTDCSCGCTAWYHGDCAFGVVTMDGENEATPYGRCYGAREAFKQCLCEAYDGEMSETA